MWRIPISCACLIAFPTRAFVTRARMRTYTRGFARTAGGRRQTHPPSTGLCIRCAAFPEEGEPRAVRPAPCCRSEDVRTGAAAAPCSCPVAVTHCVCARRSDVVHPMRGSSVVLLWDCWTKRMNVLGSIQIFRFVSRDCGASHAPPCGALEGFPPAQPEREKELLLLRFSFTEREVLSTVLCAHGAWVRLPESSSHGSRVSVCPSQEQPWALCWPGSCPRLGGTTYSTC